RPHADFRGNPQENIIIGNTVMYGAIAGEAYFRGVAGERFLVRNSGGTAVVEGVGDHGCEYMTGGTCVVLGTTGRNFAGGMSGGIAYVYDPGRNFRERCNLSMVDLEPLPAPGHTPAELRHHGEDDEALLKRLIESHARYTGSDTAKAILANWQAARELFVKVFPKEYRRALKELAAKRAGQAA
ncbi:MAG TPA: glutamate synthase subunit alpha, partial [Burkholderiales bacterium]|nr:glutamate synthase subunit alpha [Burkholderiales bacterium]